MIELRVDPRLATPPSQQLQDAVLDAIARGVLAPGDRLPSVRAAAAEALVNPNTVGKAWRTLELQGAVEGRNGSGVFVTAAGPGIARSLRRDATLDAFRQAAREAARSGHGAAALREILDSSVREQTVREEATARKGREVSKR